jgi:hypothetical protein
VQRGKRIQMRVEVEEKVDGLVDLGQRMSWKV